MLKNSFTIDLENVVIFWESAWGILKGYMFFSFGQAILLNTSLKKCFSQKFVSFLSVFVSAITC